MDSKVKRSFRKLILISALVLLETRLGFTDDVDLEKIVVTPSRIEEFSGDVSRTIDVITYKDIEKSGAQDLSDVLSDLTSVDVSDYGGVGAEKNIRMRGSTAAQVLVLMDGRPINSPRDGQVDLSTIPLENIDRVEVMHGPGSSLYGSSAMGGVVNIITKKPPEKGEESELYSSFGTARTYIERMLYGAKVDKFGYLINGGYQSSEGFRDNSEFNAKDCNVALGYGLNNENDLNFNSGFYKSRSGAPGTLSYPEKDDKQDVLKRYFDLDWSFKPDTQTIFSTKTYQNYDRLDFIDNSADTKATHTTVVRGVDLQLDKQLFDIYRMICGFNYVENSNDSTSTSKHKYNVTAGYLENRFDLLKNLIVNLSARVDDYSNFGTQVNPSFDFLYTFRDNIKFHGLISRSFRAPTFNDLYWPDEGWAKGNPDLKPERGVSEELGVESRINNRLTSGLTYFHSDYKQLIQWSDNGSGVYQPMNVNSAVIDGLELSNKISLTESFDLDVNYTYLIARDKDTHKYLVYQPMNKIDACLKYNDHKGLVVGLKGQFVGERFADAANDTKVKGFFVFGLDVSKKIRPGVTCFGYINNISNRKYQVINDYPMPGFSITGGLKLEF